MLLVCLEAPFSWLPNEEGGAKRSTEQTARGWCVMWRGPVPWCRPTHPAQQGHTTTTILPHFTQAPAQLLTWKILVQHVQANWKHRTCERRLKPQGWFPFLFQFSVIPSLASALQGGWESSSSLSLLPNACSLR